MADTRGLTLIRMHALKKNPAFLYTCIMLAATWGKWQTGKSHFRPLQCADLWRHRQFLFRQFGVAFLIVYPPPVWAHTLLFLLLAGNDIKASLYFLLKWKEGLSVSNRTSFSVCFENGMFNTMKSLSPAPLSLQRAPTPARAPFMGRNEDKGKQEADSGTPCWWQPELCFQQT